MIQAQYYLWLYKNLINPSDKRLHGYSNLIFLSKLKQWLIRNKLMLTLLNFDNTFLFKFFWGIFDRHKKKLLTQPMWTVWLCNKGKSYSSKKKTVFNLCCYDLHNNTVGLTDDMNK